MKLFLEASGSILGYGLTGLCLLLMVLTYLTLNKVIGIRNPSVQVISLVKFYFIHTIVFDAVANHFSESAFQNTAADSGTAKALF